MSFKLRNGRNTITLALFAIATGCTTAPGPPGTPPPSVVGKPPAAQPAPGHVGRPYDVSGGESLLTILAYRGGALAKAGHNHVIASHDISGTFYVPEDVSRASFELHVPVDTLTVDEPELRAKEGPDFPAEVPEPAKLGTRRNMLSEALLDGARYPQITLAGQGVQIAAGGSGSTGAGSASVQITVRDQTHPVTVPVSYSRDSGKLIASGELALRQSDLGLTPFSAMLGALQVQDELHVRFRFVAHPAATKGTDH